MSPSSAHLSYLSYVWIPTFTAFIWFATLLSMLITWLATGKPHYVTMNGTIPYISDIAADILKPLFIVGCSITAVGFFLCLFRERWLRHSGRLVPHLRTRERVFGSLAVLAAFIGGMGLILLSIFDTKRHTSLHRLFLLIYMIGVAFSAIFTIVEFRWISKDYHYVRTLKRGYIAKALIAGILIILAIAFGFTLYKATTQNAGAILEWIISLGFTLYLLTFHYDLRQSKGVNKGELNSENIRRTKNGFGRRPPIV